MAISAEGPVRRLLVRLKDHPDHTESVDFWNVNQLERQLQSFAIRRKYWAKRPPQDLHTFSNNRGETLSFSDERYLSHEVINVSEAEGT